MKLPKWLEVRRQPALLRELAEQNKFILYELKRINEALRYQKLGSSELDETQTRSSFDYQWADVHEGVAMSNDETFMKTLTSLVSEMTDLSRDWFSGKSVADIGCGAGRFSYGLLSLGARVSAFDQSPAALSRTRKLCREFGERLQTSQVNLLEWAEPAAFDLVFCFGVVHHTGNTYLAMRNVARKVKPGGRLFLMVYGFPETHIDFQEVNSYESLRAELRHLSFEERKSVLIERFGERLAHGWFDAVSPRINDLLTFGEIAELLRRFGFHRIKRTIPQRNHHLVADRMPESA